MHNLTLFLLSCVLIFISAIFDVSYTVYANDMSDSFFYMYGVMVSYIRIIWSLLCLSFT